MKVTKKLIREVIGELVGPEYVDVALYLHGKKDVSELVVAKDLKISIQFFILIFDGRKAIGNKLGDREFSLFNASERIFDCQLVEIHFSQ